MIGWLKRKLARFRRDQNGAAVIFATMTIPVIFAMASMSVDLGYMFYIKSRLQTAADLGALAGGKLLITSSVATTTTQADKVAWLNLPSEWNGVKSSVTTQVAVATACLSTAPFSSTDCNYAASGKNAIRVTATASTPMFFAAFFGMRNATMSATSLVGGGNSPPLDVVIVLDSTASMNSNTSACGASMTRQECAMKGVRGMLATLWPSVANITLMTYPGLKTGYAKYEYCASGVKDKNGKAVVNQPIPGATASPPGIAYYNGSPNYTIVADSTTYRLNPTLTPPGDVNTSDPLVMALAGGTNGCKGIQNIGGAGTYYGDVMTQAQAKLVTNAQNLAMGAPKRQGVIIILSDGDAGTSNGGFSVTKQCQKGIDAAKAASTATPDKTWVYSIAYNATTSAAPGGSCSTDSNKTTAGNTMSACQAMREMATDASKFYSVETGCDAGVNKGTTDLSVIFKNIAVSLMKTRRVSEAITN